MLYNKNKRKELSDSLFASPTSEYRGAPFWSWNCKLDKDELLRQADVLRQMGFGGYHIHVRSGMDTEYLGEEFMDLVKACSDKAEKNRMLTWLYDEDRWPSGFAGGLVTKDPKYRIRYLLFTSVPYENEKASAYKVDETQKAVRTGNGTLIARFDVKLDKDGCLESYRKLEDGENAQNALWFAYIESPALNPRFNGQTYANLMDKASIDRFIEVTHERYYEKIGDRFGKSVPAIFTDEPQFTHKKALSFPESKEDVTLPWTDDFPDSFNAAYGLDIVAHIPELIWELPEGISGYRYRYHDHACQRFTDSFAKNIGSWCENHGIKLTGHMMSEPSLSSQTAAVGEVMRSLSAFQLPGIDMLADRHEYTTAKQAASIAHQYGREGVMSELYGVTGWDFDFRGHKLQGDWQAALGVSVRVPHLSWVSMEGESKRDYPASINYQSSWYKKYSYVEDHFARLNTALTRGKPLIRVGVIHPVESLWLHWGPSNQTAAVRSDLDSKFASVTEWLLMGDIDFDYVSESLLPELCKTGTNPLTVGKMKYDAIIVPGCETLRSTTVERLQAFRKAGGKLIFAGIAPKYMDAQPSPVPASLFADSEHCDFTQASLLEKLEDVREVDIRYLSGSCPNNMIYQLRADGKYRWLFTCRGKHPGNCDLSNFIELFITVRGLWNAKLYNTLDGSVTDVSVTHKNGKTVIRQGYYIHDSALFRLEPADTALTFEKTTGPEKRIVHEELEIKDVKVGLNEPNAAVLDIFEYSFDGGEWQKAEEILRIDTKLRRSLDWTPWGGSANQPWCIEKEPITHSLRLRCSIDSSVSVRAPKLALEAAETTKIIFNGEAVESKIAGWYTDKSIKTVALPPLRKGKNTFEFEMPFGKRTAAERMYLLGNFSVNVRGSELTIGAPVKSLGFDSIVSQGLPFYGGAVSYSFEVTTKLPVLNVRLPHYRAAVLDISLDGGKPVTAAFAPYLATFRDVYEGTHTVTVTAYISRQNAFGPIHLGDQKMPYQSPAAWRTVGDSWTYSYRLAPEGLISAPVIYETD